MRKPNYIIIEKFEAKVTSSTKSISVIVSVSNVKRKGLNADNAIMINGMFIILNCAVHLHMFKGQFLFGIIYRKKNIKTFDARLQNARMTLVYISAVLVLTLFLR